MVWAGSVPARYYSAPLGSARLRSARLRSAPPRASWLRPRPCRVLRSADAAQSVRPCADGDALPSLQGRGRRSAGGRPGARPLPESGAGSGSRAAPRSRARPPHVALRQGPSAQCSQREAQRLPFPPRGQMAPVCPFLPRKILEGFYKTGSV